MHTARAPARHVDLIPNKKTDCLWLRDIVDHLSAEKTSKENNCDKGIMRLDIKYSIKEKFQNI